VGSSFAVLGELAGGMIDALRQARSSPIRAKLDDLSMKTRTLALPLRYGGLSREQVQHKLEQWKEKFADFLETSREEIPEDWSINAMIKQKARARGLGEAETRRWVAEQFTYVSFLNIYKKGGEAIDSGKGEIHCPIAVLDFGSLKILGAPMEVLMDVAFDWQRRFPDRLALVCGLFGGWIGYLPHKSNYEEPRADQLYETVSTMFAADASLKLLETAQGMMGQGD
jgi:hypothetical protein